MVLGERERERERMKGGKRIGREEVVEMEWRFWYLWDATTYHSLLSIFLTTTYLWLDFGVYSIVYNNVIIF